MTRKRNGAHLLLELLESEGVNYIFGNPGTTELPLIDALIDFPTIEYIWGLQEASVVAMADGYAQASGKPGFINLHTAGGLGHGLGNLLNAVAAMTPLVVTAGQQDTRHAISDPLLLGDLKSIAGPASKWAQEVTNAEQLPVLIRRAFQDSASAPYGPVFLSLPMDVMEQMTDVDVPPVSVVDRRPVAGSIELLAKHLADIAPGKTAIIAGDEVAFNDAREEVVTLSEILAAPVFGSSWPARLPFPTTHYNWRGNLSTKASEIGDALREFDGVFALGGKSFITILYTEGSALPDGCQLYQMSVDGRDLGRTYPSELSVVGDIKRSLEELNTHLSTLLADKSDQYNAIRLEAKVRSESEKERRLARADTKRKNNVIHPIVAAQELVRAIPTEVPIIDEAIAVSKHMREFIDSQSSKQYAFIRGGGLGWGMPASIGYSLGVDRKAVVSVVGDGAAMYSPQAIWTAAYEKLPVTFVVINNLEYNVLKNFLRSKPDYISAQTGQFIAMDLVDPKIDFLALGRSMGVTGVRIDRARDIFPTVQASIRSMQPNLIEIIVSA